MNRGENGPPLETTASSTFFFLFNIVQYYVKPLESMELPAPSNLAVFMVTELKIMIWEYLSGLPGCVIAEWLHHFVLHHVINLTAACNLLFGFSFYSAL
jgi:hypothetical protein